MANSVSESTHLLTQGLDGSTYDEGRVRALSSPKEKEWMRQSPKDWENIEALAESRKEVVAPDEPEDSWFSWKLLWVYAGPGLLMSISYVDPGNLESDLQSGAYSGYQLLWVLFWATALGFILQMLAARIGVVTGKNLADLCRLEYSRPKAMALWIMIEIAIIGSDVQEVLGSAIAFQLLFGMPLWVGCLLTGFDTVTFLGLHHFGIRKLEAFFGILIATMLVCFACDLVSGGTPVRSLLMGTSIPSISRHSVVQAVGTLGAVIMPHNIFLHSALVQTRNVDRFNTRKVAEANKYFSLEAALALVVSYLINAAVLGVFAKGFYSDDCAALASASGKNSACLPLAGTDAGVGYGACVTADGFQGGCREIGLSDAGSALSAVLGENGATVWAIGLLAAGQSSTMTGTYAGQFVMEGFLRFHIAPWKRVALTRVVALVPAITVALINETAKNTSDWLGEVLNVLQSLLLPFALLPVLHFNSNANLMGTFTISNRVQVMVWLIALFVMAINVVVLTTSVSAESHSPSFYALVAVVATAYYGFLLSLISEDLSKWKHFLLAFWSKRRGHRSFDISPEIT